MYMKYMLYHFRNLNNSTDIYVALFDIHERDLQGIHFTCMMKYCVNGIILVNYHIIVMFDLELLSPQGNHSVE